MSSTVWVCEGDFGCRSVGLLCLLCGYVVLQATTKPCGGGKVNFQDANSKSKSPGEFALEWREFWMAKDKQQAFIFIGFLNLFRMKWLRHCKRNHGRDLHYELDSMQYNYVLFILYYKTDILSFNSFVKLLTSRGNGAFKLLAYNELIRRYQ